MSFRIYVRDGKYYINDVEVNKEDYKKYVSKLSDLMLNPDKFSENIKNLEALIKEVEPKSLVLSKDFIESSEDYNLVFELKEVSNAHATYNSKEKVLSLELNDLTINYCLKNKIKTNITEMEQCYRNSILSVMLRK